MGISSSFSYGEYVKDCLTAVENTKNNLYHSFVSSNFFFEEEYKILLKYKVVFKWIPRGLNVAADTLSKIASGISDMPLFKNSL